MTRISANGAPVGLSQRISLIEALSLDATGAAAAAGEADFKGALSRARLADLAVLAGDIVEAQPERLSSTSVLATWVGGRVAWTALGDGGQRGPTDGDRQLMHTAKENK